MTLWSENTFHSTNEYATPQVHYIYIYIYTCRLSSDDTKTSEK